VPSDGRDLRGVRGGKHARAIYHPHTTDLTSGFRV